MVTRVFQSLLLLSPICVGADINMDMFDIIFFRTGIIALFCFSLIDTPRRRAPEYLNKIIFSLLIISIFNIFVHTFNPTVLHNTMNLFLGVVGLYIVYTYWDEKQNMTKFILWAGAINLILFISQKIGFNPVFDKMPYAGQEGAFLGNQPRLMTYFSLLTPFLPIYLLPLPLFLGLYTKQIIIFLPLTIIILSRIKLVRERLHIGRIIYIPAIILIVAGIYLFRQHILSSLAFRFDMAWKPALTAFFKQPLLGLGLGVRPIPELEVVGNSYLQFILGVGIIGAIWLGYVFKVIYNKIKNNRESIALISLLGVAFVEYLFELPRLWFLIIGIIMAFTVKGVKNEITI